MANKLFAIHSSEFDDQNDNTLHYQGLWVPERGIVNAIDHPELSQPQQIAGWWTGRIALARLTKIVPEHDPEVRASEEATDLLDPLFAELERDREQILQAIIGRQNGMRARPSYLRYPSESTVASALAVEDVDRIYERETGIFGPVLVNISDRFGVTVDPSSPLGSIVTLGKRYED